MTRQKTGLCMCMVFSLTVLAVSGAVEAQIAPGTYSGEFACGVQLQTSAGAFKAPLVVSVKGNQLEWLRSGTDGRDNVSKFEERASALLQPGSVPISGKGGYAPGSPMKLAWTISGSLKLDGSTLRGKVDQVADGKVSRECVATVPVQLIKTAEAGGRPSASTDSRAQAFAELKAFRQEAINVLASWETGTRPCVYHQDRFAQTLDKADTQVSQAMDRGQLDTPHMINLFASHYKLHAKNIRELGENMRCIR